MCLKASCLPEWLYILYSIPYLCFGLSEFFTQIQLLTVWNTVCCLSTLRLFICFSFHDVSFPCHLPDKHLFTLRWSLQVSPPPWSPPWLPLIHRLFCPLSWASLEAHKSNSFFFLFPPTAHVLQDTNVEEILSLLFMLLWDTIPLPCQNSIRAPLKYMSSDYITPTSPYEND